ncbi:MAG: alginate lyase family protein [Alphaproteobacteria bacterium]
MTSFVLFRIVGNDPDPDHAIARLRLILRHEPTLPGCEKRWIVDRIADPAREAETLRLIQAAGHAFVHRPFDWAAHAGVPLLLDAVPRDRRVHTRGYEALDPRGRAAVVADLLGARRRHALDRSAARNRALGDGRAIADWVLPWDDDCFLTAAGWRAIVEAARSGAARHLLVPTVSLADDAMVLDPAFSPTRFGPPLVAFGPGSTETYDEALGEAAATRALLASVGSPSPAAAPDRTADRPVGWVGVLARRAGAARDPSVAAEVRLLRRIEAIGLRWARARRPAGRPALLLYDPAALDRLRAEWRAGMLRATMRVMDLRAAARQALERPPSTILDRPPDAPAGDDPRDLHRADPADEDAERGKTDAIRLQDAAHDAIVLAIVARLLGEQRHAERGAAIVRAWLVDPASAMNPHLRAAGAAHAGGEGTARGLVDGRGILPMLDAARLLRACEALSGAAADAVDRWVAALLEWLRTSRQAADARQSGMPAGTAWAMLTLACELHLGRLAPAAQELDWLALRIDRQFDADGRRVWPRAIPLHAPEALRELELWATVARIADGVGRDIRGPAAPGRGSLAAAARCMHAASLPPEVPEPLRAAVAARIETVRAMLAPDRPETAIHGRIARFNPGAGLPPFWAVAPWPHASAPATDRIESSQRPAHSLTMSEGPPGAPAREWQTIGNLGWP